MVLCYRYFFSLIVLLTELVTNRQQSIAKTTTFCSSMIEIPKYPQKKLNDLKWLSQMKYHYENENVIRIGTYGTERIKLKEFERTTSDWKKNCGWCSLYVYCVCNAFKSFYNKYTTQHSDHVTVHSLDIFG